MSQEESRHPIQVVSRRSGLSADTIRVWERRYGAVLPRRAENNRRLYTDDDVERLSLLRLAIAGGRRIGDVAGLATDELRDLVQEDRQESQGPAAAVSTDAPGSEAEEIVAECLQAAERLDAAGLEGALRRASTRLGLYSLMDEVISPLMRAVGDRWSRGVARISQEHLTSALVRALLGMLSADGAGSPRGPRIVITTPSGQTHELGALMAAAAASAEGWQVLYLGPDTPADEIAHAVGESGSVAVALSAVYPNGDARFLKELERTRELLPRNVSLFVGGHAVMEHQEQCRRIGAVPVPDLQTFARSLAELT